MNRAEKRPPQRILQLIPAPGWWAKYREQREFDVITGPKRERSKLLGTKVKRRLFLLVGIGN
jgi:hypothetical protein